ncbi:hypothetical protein D8682_10480 [Buttiauxella sp. 3AFRM03]|nr:hypothetical protein D8682_10480 [Buttiauxella sp. 3AFRM03]
MSCRSSERERSSDKNVRNIFEQRLRWPRSGSAQGCAEYKRQVFAGGKPQSHLRFLLHLPGRYALKTLSSQH